MDYTIRPIEDSEINILDDFLYEAIFIPEGVKKPSQDIISKPELQIYVEGFGTEFGDLCLVAEVDGKIVGAVWSRIMDDYGHIDDETPSLAISLYEAFRGHGIGTALMKKKLDLLRAKGFKRASLSVQKANYAFGMYRKVGFKIVKDHGEECVMLIEL